CNHNILGSSMCLVFPGPIIRTVYSQNIFNYWIFGLRMSDFMLAVNSSQILYESFLGYSKEIIIVFIHVIRFKIHSSP
ncbi:hypothetical protein L9F63_016127, partial [Diploptera punctata]